MSTAEIRSALLEQRLRRPAQPRPTIPRHPGDLAPPLSFAQERLWFMEQIAPGTATIRVAVQVPGGVRSDHLAQALQELVDRNDTLRSVFPDTDTGRAEVAVLPHLDVPLEKATADTLAAAVDLVEDFTGRPFDLTSPPLIRALLVEPAGGGSVVGIAMHHIVADGWSTNLIVTELLDRCAALARGSDRQPAALPVRYGDYAAWQRDRLAGAAGQDGLRYWCDQLDGLPQLELPTERPRPPRQQFSAAAHEFEIDAELLAEVEATSRRHGVTQFMTLLAAYQCVLSRWSGQSDFAVGSPVAGRSRPELESLVGLFSSVVVLRAPLDGDPTVTELLRRTKDLALDAYANQETPFEEIIKALGVPRDLSRSPLFGATLAVHNYTGGSTGGSNAVSTEHDWSFLPLSTTNTRYEMELSVQSTGTALRCVFTYSTALFDAATMARLTDRLTAVLRQFGSRPQARLSELVVLDAAERELLVSTWNDTGTDYPGGTLVSLLDRQAALTPDARALCWDGGSMTFADLQAASSAVAAGLQRLGAGAETVVGVLADRSPELVVALCGVLRAGAAYLPLDPEYPVDRLAYMVADSGATLVLEHTTTHHDLPSATRLRMDDPSWQSGPPHPSTVQPDDAAYVIYTSGSTGRPKGVVNTHRGIVNRLHWMQAAYPLDAGDAVLQKTPASFDVSVWEFFWPLITGARLVLAAPGGHRDVEYLRRLVTEQQVTTAHFVPSMLGLFLADDPGGSGGEPGDSCRSLRRVICSGEELPVAVARRFLARLPWCELHNLYGPTEAAIDVTAWHCRDDALAQLYRVPIGTPIGNLRVYVLDDRGGPVGIGIPGELFIAGVGVARGYLNRPALTAARFVPDPFGPPGQRMYRTGDRARWRSDGTLDFLGRLDGQVKLRGVRIELGEIETILATRPGVREAVVIVREDVPGDARLVAYLVGSAGPVDISPVDTSELRTALRARLPEALVPAAFVVLDEWPLSPNGKLDRDALPAPDRSRDGADLRAPDTPTEIVVASIWADLLGIDAVGLDEDFFDLGGHSLLATQVVAQIRAARPADARQVGVVDLFAHRTVGELAALLDTADTGPRRLLHRLTRSMPAVETVRTFVCIPYGGGSAVVYQPLADALPAGNALVALAIPGHDLGIDEQSLDFDELARRCAEEVVESVDGPVVLYGHCGVGGALMIEVARLLERSGRQVEAVYAGAIFPFARPAGLLARLGRRTESLTSNRRYTNWLASMGVDMSEIDPAQADRIVSAMRQDSLSAEAYFTELIRRRVEPLQAPIITIVGDRDPMTDYYQERFREWHFLADSVAVVVLDEAGHYFLKYRADELADILTRTHPAVSGHREAGNGTGTDTDIGTDSDIGTDTEGLAALRRSARGEDPGWWLHDIDHRRVDRRPDAVQPDAVRRPEQTGERSPEPSMRRFFTVAAGQLASMIGSALTEFAVPLWVYLRTGSVTQFGLLAVLGLVPGLLVSPVAGAVVDRWNRRTVLMAAGAVAVGTELAMGLLIWADALAVWHLYLLVALLSMALTCQRLAYFSAIPQLVPKHFLGHAVGFAQMSAGLATVAVPLVAVGLVATVGLGGVLVIDIVSYALALGVLALVRFPDLLGWKPKESLATEIVQGVRYAWGQRGFRYLLVYFALVNLTLSPMLLLSTPLVLSFDTLTTVGVISVVAGAGLLAGGVVMAIWGGPRTRRMPAIFWATAAMAVSGLLAGLRPAPVLVAIGLFGLTLSLTVLNGVYATIIQVKVPQRFHGRVFALQTMAAWSTLPIGFAVIGPLGTAWLNPLLTPDGALASTVGVVLGTGPGRGIGLLYVLLALAMLGIVAGAVRTRTLPRVDTEIADALPDDLVGLQARAARRQSRRQVPEVVG